MVFRALCANLPNPAGKPSYSAVMYTSPKARHPDTPPGHSSCHKADVPPICALRAPLDTWHACSNPPVWDAFRVGRRHKGIELYVMNLLRGAAALRWLGGKFCWAGSIACEEASPARVAVSTSCNELCPVSIAGGASPGRLPAPAGPQMDGSHLASASGSFAALIAHVMHYLAFDGSYACIVSQR